MIIGILKEQVDKRVSLIPSTVKKLTDQGYQICLEPSSGQSSFFEDEKYREAGAKTCSREEVINTSDIICSIHPIPMDEYKATKEGCIVIALFAPFNNPSIATDLKGLRVNALSLDMIPRITLAQSMDVLSSMASVAGYKSILEAANIIPRYLPMMITAAGSIKPAKVLILGAGVAGLQAIATAKRLGAMVEAFDTRTAAKEEVESLGARFVEVAGAKDDTNAGGYAVTQSDDYIKRQREEVQKRATNADIIVTTAQVRGRKAPILIPGATVEKMKSGSVIIDLASSTGGNCELSKDEELIVHNGVYILGNSNLASRMPQDSSTLFSTNIFNLIKHLSKSGEFQLDMEDPIVSSALITMEKAKEKT